MVRLLCVPPAENLRPNDSSAAEAAGKLGEERLPVFTILNPKYEQNSFRALHCPGALRGFALRFSFRLGVGVT